MKDKTVVITGATSGLARMLHEIDENYLFLYHIENCVQEKPIVTHI